MYPCSIMYSPHIWICAHVRLMYRCRKGMNGNECLHDTNYVSDRFKLYLRQQCVITYEHFHPQLCLCTCTHAHTHIRTCVCEHPQRRPYVCYSIRTFINSNLYAPLSLIFELIKKSLCIGILADKLFTKFIKFSCLGLKSSLWRTRKKIHEKIDVALLILFD